MGIGSSKCQKDLKLEKDAIKAFLNDETEIFKISMDKKHNHHNEYIEFKKYYQTSPTQYNSTRKSKSKLDDMEEIRFNRGGRTRRRRNNLFKVD